MRVFPTFNSLYSVAEAAMEYRALVSANAPAFRVNDAGKRLEEALALAGFGDKLKEVAS